MKVAHLILVHAYPDQLERLVNRLQHPDADIFIHVDKGAAIADFAYLGTNYSVRFISERARIYWGTYSMIRATLNSFREILSGDDNIYSHINLLSAQDYPLKSASEIHDFLSANQDKTFMHSLIIPDEWGEAIDRIQTYNFGDYRFKGHYALQHLVKFLGIKKKMPAGIKPYGRSQWFTITPQCALYVINYLKDNPRIERFFRMSFAPDEFLFQTILMNSPFSKNLINDNLRYIDFSQGGYHPKVLTMDDAYTLTSSGKLYARKFTLDLSKDLMDNIDHYIEQENIFNYRLWTKDQATG